MENSDRKLWVLANRIHQQLQPLHRSRFGEVTRRIRQFIDSAERLRRADNLLAFSLDRGWRAAAGHMLDRIAQELRDVPFHVNDALRAIESAKPKLPSVQDILADLRQAEEEFGDFRHEEDEEEGDLLVVTTEAIELQDRYLGQFEIQLKLGSLSAIGRHTSAYRVVALDPHPASSNDSVTHPHVSDERLCEGDAGAAIGAALANGRVCDFFQLVRAVLTTYNPHSPYVALEDWEGRPCHSCGYTTGADGMHWCNSCEEDFCDQCASYCRCCDDTTCSECLHTCEACNNSVCPSCMTKCDDCGRSICKSCKEDTACPCVDENEENEDDPEPDDESAESGTGSVQEGCQPEGPEGRTAQPARQVSAEAA